MSDGGLGRPHAMGSAATRLFESLAISNSAEAKGIAYAGACIGIGLVNIAAAIDRLAQGTVAAAAMRAGKIVQPPPGMKF